MTSGGGDLQRAPRPSSLYEVLDLVLDKGVVIDVYVRASVVGIELFTIDARVVVASVDTYLRFAEAVNRLDLSEHGGIGLPDLVQKGAEKAFETGARTVTKRKLGGAIEGAKEKVADVKDTIADLETGDDDEDAD